MLDGVFGFVVGGLCQVVLDNGNIFRFVISSIGGTTLFFAGQPLPSGVGGSFADPLENAVIQLGTGSRSTPSCFSNGAARCCCKQARDRCYWKGDRSKCLARPSLISPQPGR